MMKQEFFKVGQEQSKIDVRISYRIIQLFSEGLYSSASKAIEELVSNSFDAGATNVHVILAPDLAAEDATITVIDDGIGMDEQGLREHWLIGITNKRKLGTQWPKGRKQIGKFGIGKLATYVLANRLTHISKVGSKYYSTSMNYSKIPTGEAGGIYTEKTVTLPLRLLTEKQAKEALSLWLDGSKPGYKAIKLFGSGAAKSWTVAIMSDLKHMASEIQRGRLRWILQTAMPLRDDFNLYLNGDKIPPSKLAANKVGRWVLGKDLNELPKPAPKDLEATEAHDEDKNSIYRYGLTHPQLGRVAGYTEIYESPLDTGKSTDIERSHGFFVYVRGRLVNIDDPGFGISRNLLRHGTFSRFRMVVHIDQLDEELRSSRETLREGVLFNIAQNLLHGVFNHARVKLEEHETAQSPGIQIASRIAASPGSLTRRPIIGLVTAALEGKFRPRYISYPQNLTRKGRSEFLDRLRQRAETSQGLVESVQLIELSQEQGVAVLDVETGILKINTLHPFVAHFLDEYEDKKRSLPLELLAASEVLLEAHLYELGLDESQVHDALAHRDESLRYLARSTGKRNAYMVAHDLLDATSDKNALELALVAAFDSMGFEAVPLGGSGKPDGIAEARLAATEEGKSQRYFVSLEAKSKEREGKKVSAQSVNVSAIARHRNNLRCDHAIVVGPDFPTGTGDESALVKEIQDDKGKTGKTITLIRIVDMARLVRLVPLKRIGLDRIRELFETCITPEQSKEWIERLAREGVKKVPYREILETIWGLQNEQPSEAVEYAGIAVALRRDKNIKITKDELMKICEALSRMATGMIAARKGSVELSQRPDKVVDAIGAVIQQYPEEEQPNIQTYL